MPGTFSKSNRPKRPGAYVNWVAAQQETIIASSLGVVAVPFTHPWGPANTVVPLGDLGEFLGVYGQIAPASSGQRAVDYAFRGSGIAGEAGAGQVLAYRMVGTGAVKSSLALGPAAALTLEAVYPGAYGNNIKVAVVADASDATNYANLVLFLGTTEIERYRYAKTDINNLAAQIAASDWVAVKGAVTSGSALTAIPLATPSSLASGVDGTIAAGDYTNALAALDIYRFGLLAFDNLTDEAVHTSVATWVTSSNRSGKRVMLVVGGALNELLGTGAGTTGTALYRSKTIYQNENVVNIGVGSISDDRYGVVSTAGLAPRIAGILAARGEARNLTFARLAGVNILAGSSSSGILDAIDGGVVVLSRDSHPVAPVRIEKGVTTYTLESDANKPRNIFSVPKYMRTMHALEMELTEFAEFNIIGNAPVSDETRSYLRADAELRLKRREEDGIVQPGWTVDIDKVPAPTTQDEFVALVIQMAFGRSLEQIYYTITVS